MDKYIALAKSIKKEYLDKGRKIKTKPSDKIMNIFHLKRYYLYWSYAR